MPQANQFKLRMIQGEYERILRNLITNAVDHGEGRGVRIQVRKSENEVAIGVQRLWIRF
jgi:two-component system sensor histidine kinase MtrB